MPIIHCLPAQRVLFTSMLAALLLAGDAEAVVLFDFVLDPATSAGGGSTSTQSGVGSWHLYAYDNTEGSVGIAAYNIVLQNTLTNFHRSPASLYQGAEDKTHDLGFGLFRTEVNVPTMIAAQPLWDAPNQIFGFGRESSNFATAIPADVTLLPPTVSSGWGDNTTRPSSDSSLPWLFVAEGTYSVGTPPKLGYDTNVNLYRDDLRQFAATICTVDGCKSPPSYSPPSLPIPEVIPTSPTEPETLPEVVATPTAPVFPVTVVPSEELPEIDVPPQGEVVSEPTVWLPPVAGGLPPIDPVFPEWIFEPTVGGPHLMPTHGWLIDPWFPVTTIDVPWTTKPGFWAPSLIDLIDIDYSPFLCQLEMGVDPSKNVIFNSQSQVPEPATVALIGLAVIGFIGLARRR